MNYADMASQLLDPLYNYDGPAPGFWGRRVKEFSWLRFKFAKINPDSLLYALQPMPLLREPGLRATTRGQKSGSKARQSLIMSWLRFVDKQYGLKRYGK